MFIFGIKIFHRRTILLLVFIGSLFATTGSDARQIREDISISLPLGPIRLDSLSERLRVQGGYVLSFNAGRIRPASAIDISKSPVHLSALLTDLRDKYGLSSGIVGDHIILDRLPGNKPEIQERNLRPPVPGRQASTLPAEPLTRRTEKGKNISVPEKESAGRNESGFLQIDPAPLKRNFTWISRPSVPVSLPLHLPVTVIEKLRSASGSFTREIDPPSGAPGTTTLTHKFIFSAGLTADESFYLSPAVRMGFPFLYLTGSWHTNFRLSGFEYGIGGSYKLAGKWGVHLQINRGALKKNFSWHYGLVGSSAPSGDSTFIIKTKGTLLRGELLMEKRTGNKLSLQFGPVFNLLRYKIYADGKPIYAVPSFPVNMDVNEKYYLLNPPYLLAGSYHKDKSSGRKVWIGLQVGLFYRF